MVAPICLMMRLIPFPLLGCTTFFTHIHTHAHRVGSQDAAAGAVLLPVSVLLRNPPEGVKKGTGMRLILFSIPPVAVFVLLHFNVQFHNGFMRRCNTG